MDYSDCITYIEQLRIYDMKWLEALGSYTLAVIFALIVTFGLPGDGKNPSLIEAMLSLMAIGMFSLGIYQTIAVLMSDYAKGDYHG